MKILLEQERKQKTEKGVGKTNPPLFSTEFPTRFSTILAHYQQSFPQRPLLALHGHSRRKFRLDKL